MEFSVVDRFIPDILWLGGVFGRRIKCLHLQTQDRADFHRKKANSFFAVSITPRYMVGKARHVKTTVYHASKEISTEADFQDIFKLHHYSYGLKPTAMQIHVLVDFSVSSWGRLIPTEYRQYYTALDE